MAPRLASGKIARENLDPEGFLNLKGWGRTISTVTATLKTFVLRADLFCLRGTYLIFGFCQPVFEKFFRLTKNPAF